MKKSFLNLFLFSLTKIISGLVVKQKVMLFELMREFLTLIFIII